MSVIEFLTLWFVHSKRRVFLRGQHYSFSNNRPSFCQTNANFGKSYMSCFRLSKRSTNQTHQKIETDGRMSDWVHIFWEGIGPLCSYFSTFVLIAIINHLILSKFIHSSASRTLIVDFGALSVKIGGISQVKFRTRSTQRLYLWTYI